MVGMGNEKKRWIEITGVSEKSVLLEGSRELRAGDLGQDVRIRAGAKGLRMNALDNHN